MTKSGLNWRDAQLPPNTALFAIGDIHGHHDLLGPMLASIEEKIAKLPEGTTAQIVFVGDYIDRGPSSPKTIEMLLDFEQRMQSTPNVKTTFLCGNHEEFFARLLETSGITDRPIITKNLISKLGAPEAPKITLKDLEDFLFHGNGSTTVMQYLPDVDPKLFDPVATQVTTEKGVKEVRKFNRDYPDFSLEMVNGLVKKLQDAVPPAHKDFFKRVYGNSHLILGDYLLVHGGIDPKKNLAELGIGDGAATLTKEEYFQFLMIRNEFLWRDDLPNCPYVVIHGHTPSAIKQGLPPAEYNGLYFDAYSLQAYTTGADPQKDYRLCIDTYVYDPSGSLTCFMRQGDEAYFMAIDHNAPDKGVYEYGVPKVGSRIAEAQHTALYPQHHRAK